MTRTVLPQQHCADVTDHRPHTVISGITKRPWYFCPGRYTPANYRAPHVSPVVPSDPFAGIPGADSDEEW